MPEKGTVAGVGSWETRSADCSREACSEDSPWKGRTQVSGCCARKVPLSRSRTRIATRSRKLRPDARHAATAPPVQCRRRRGRQATSLFDARPSGLEYPQPSRAASIARRCDDLKPLVHGTHSRSLRRWCQLTTTLTWIRLLGESSQVPRISRRFGGQGLESNWRHKDFQFCRCRGYWTRPAC